MSNEHNKMEEQRGKGFSLLVNAATASSNDGSGTLTSTSSAATAQGMVQTTGSQIAKPAAKKEDKSNDATMINTAKSNSQREGAAEGHPDKQHHVKPPPAKENVDEDTSNDAEMLKTVKAISGDPLVQMSMMRVLKQFPPDVRREREKALAEKASMAKKKKSVPDSSRSQTKKSVKADASGHNNRAASRGSKASPSPPPPPLGARVPVPAQSSQSFQGCTGKRPPEVQSGGSMPRSSQGKVSQPSTSQGMGSQAGPEQLLALLQSNSASLPQAPNLSSAVLQLAMGNPGIMQLLGTVMAPPGINPNIDSNRAGQGVAAASMPSVSAQNSNKLLNERGVDTAGPTGERAGAAEAGYELKIPCRARGMDSNHNFSNAHFVIPHDVKHGHDLICSYPPCRANGIKFRYCLFCRLPVARRNFRLRHYHKDEVPQPPPRGSKNLPDPICQPVAQYAAQNYNEVPNVAERPPQQLPVDDLNMISSGGSSDKRKRRGSSRDVEIPLTIQTSNENVSGEDARNSPQRHSRRGDKTSSREKKRREHSRKKLRKHPKRKRDGDRGDDERRSKRHKLLQPATEEANVATAAAIPKSTKHSKRRSGTKRKHEKPRKKNESMSGRRISSKRQQVWSDLLRKRPSSSEDEGMSKWLMKVMAVSDLLTPLKNEGEDSSSPSSLTLDELGSDDLSP